MPDDLGPIVEDVTHARKYRFLCEAAVRRVAAWACERGGSQKDIVKRTKRKLHQVYAAYLEGWAPEAAARVLDGLGPDPSQDALRAACRQVLALHASTRERMPLLDTTYQELFAVTGVPARLLDLGCGLHPFAIPWMGLPRGARYDACEIDSRMADLGNRVLRLTGVEGAVACRDVLTDVPGERADVALLLKMVPCLEQQEKGCAGRIISAIAAPFVVVSFPTRTLGGRGMGVASGHAALMEQILRGRAWRVTEIRHPQEAFFVLDKR